MPPKPNIIIIIVILYITKVPVTEKYLSSVLLPVPVLVPIPVFFTDFGSTGTDEPKFFIFRYWYQYYRSQSTGTGTGTGDTGSFRYRVALPNSGAFLAGEVDISAK